MQLRRRFLLFGFLVAVVVGGVQALGSPAETVRFTPADGRDEVAQSQPPVDLVVTSHSLGDAVVALFSAQTWWSPHPSGYVLASAVDGRIQLLDSRGGSLASVVVRGPHRVISKQAAVNSWAESYRRLEPDNTNADLRRRVRLLEQEFEAWRGFVADSTPLLTQLLVDHRGLVWVRRFDEAAWPAGLSDTWDVLDRNLVHCGTIRLPDIDYVSAISDWGVLGARREARGVYILSRTQTTQCNDA